MYIKARKSYIGICLLVCCLFLANFVSVIDITGSAFTDVNMFDNSSAQGESQQPSMNGTANIGHFDYLSAADTFIYFSAISAQQSRSQSAKFIFYLLTALAAVLLICLVYSSRLSARFCTPFNAIGITVFLHQKDGMK